MTSYALYKTILIMQGYQFSTRICPKGKIQQFRLHGLFQLRRHLRFPNANPIVTPAASSSATPNARGNKQVAGPSMVGKEDSQVCDAIVFAVESCERFSVSVTRFYYLVGFLSREWERERERERAIGKGVFVTFFWRFCNLMCCFGNLMCRFGNLMCCFCNHFCRFCNLWRLGTLHTEFWWILIVTRYMALL